MKIGSGFWRPVLLLVSGNGVGQLITFLSIPILTRMYPPENFGVLALFTAVVLTLTVVVNGGYEWPIMLPEEESEAQNLVVISIWVSLGVSCGILLLALVSEIASIAPRGWTLFDYWKWVVPVSLLMEGLLNPIKIWINRQRKYRLLSSIKIARSCFQAGVSLLMGWLDILPMGLIWGFWAGQIAALGVALVYYISTAGIAGFRINLQSWQMLTHTYRDFPQYSILSTLFVTLSKQLPFFLFPLLFIDGDTINGFFSKAEQLLLAPISLISMSIGSVFFERASQASRRGDAFLAKETRDTFHRLCVLGLPSLIIGLFIGPTLYQWLLGPEWKVSGEYARWLSPYLYVLFLMTPLSCLVDIRRTLRSFLWITFFLLLGRFCLLYVGGHYLSAKETIHIYAIGSFVLVVLQLLYLLYMGRYFQTHT